jgi:hypothetical protein
LKYLDMIKRGHLPFHHNRVNEDARVFLQRLLPRGTAADRFTLAATCRTLYLAFKQMDAGEVYDVLAVCLIPGGGRTDSPLASDNFPYRDRRGLSGRAPQDLRRDDSL